MSNVICTDDRFEVIAKYKAKLLDKTNIETSADEMAVIDNILFRVWQMGWLDRLEQPTVEAVPIDFLKQFADGKRGYYSDFVIEAVKAYRERENHAAD